MKPTNTRARSFVAALGLCLLATRGAFAGAHTWKVNEVFSNADGTIQFIELRESGGGTGEIGVPGHMVTSNTQNYTIPQPVLVSPTSFKSLLFATPAFAALPGAPAPDYIFPASQVPFFSTAGGADLFRYVSFDSWTVPAGSIPLDGYNSFNRTGGALPNSPTNYAGATATIDLRPPAPSGVPDGATAGQAPMTVSSFDAAQNTITMSWDVTSCTGGGRYHLIYGGKTQLPAAPGGAFAVDGGVCGLNATMPFVWTSVPAPSDGTSLLWWMVLADDGATVEGPWGHGSNGLERNGPGTGGASAVCAITSKTVANACGH